MKIRYLFIDVDGTLTDGRLHYNANGEVFKSFDVKDGYGIANTLPRNGIEAIVITGRNSLINKKRLGDLGVVRIYQSISNKLELIEVLVGSDFPSVAYIGDDVNDLEAIIKIKKNGGLTGCPKDAIKEITQAVDFVSNHKGGYGAVREFIDWIISLS